MNAIRFSMAALVFLGAASIQAIAQDVERQPDPVRPRPILQQGQLPLLATEGVEKLKLSDEQKDKYGKIESEYKDAAKAALDKFRADIKDVRDREKYKELTAAFQADTKKVRDDHLAKVEPILNADQKKVFAEVQKAQPNPRDVRPVPPIGVGGAGVGQILPPAIQARMNLTDEQKAQIEAIQKEVEAKILKLLNDEQKKQYEQLKKGTPPRIRPVRPNPQADNEQPAPRPAIIQIRRQ